MIWSKNTSNSSFANSPLGGVEEVEEIEVAKGGGGGGGFWKKSVCEKSGRDASVSSWKGGGVEEWDDR